MRTRGESARRHAQGHGVEVLESTEGRVAVQEHVFTIRCAAEQLHGFAREPLDAGDERDRVEARWRSRTGTGRFRPVRDGVWDVVDRESPAPEMPGEHRRVDEDIRAWRKEDPRVGGRLESGHDAPSSRYVHGN